MKKLLLGFLAGILCCIIIMVVLIVKILFKKDQQSTETAPTSIVKTIDDNSTMSENSFTLTGTPTTQNSDTITNSNDNTNNQVAAIGNTNNNDIINNIESLNNTNQTEITISTNDLSAVHGRGGKGHLRAVPSQYTQKDEYVHTNVYAPLMAMIKSAQADGIRLSIVSAYRSYDHQKRIWERKWGDTDNSNTQKALEILRYSSFPGTSRHHWGTDIDFNSVSPAYWQKGEGKRTHDWLMANAPNFGFCQTYGYGRNGGYANEDWHWSHIPTANQYYAQINNPQVLAIATHQPIKGAKAVQKLDAHLYSYIQGISPCNNVKNRQFSTNELAIATPPQNQRAIIPVDNGHSTTNTIDNYDDLAHSLPKKPTDNPIKSEQKSKQKPQKKDEQPKTNKNKPIEASQDIVLEPINIPPQPTIQRQGGITLCGGNDCMNNK